VYDGPRFLNFQTRLWVRGDVVGLFRRREFAGPEAADLLNSAPDGILIVDGEGKIVMVNAQTETLFGYSRAELLGQAVEILMPARFAVLHLKHRAAFAADPRLRPMGRNLDLFGRRKNGAEFPVEISLSPLQTQHGLFVISTVRDVSERKRSEDQIKKLNAELGDALRRVERLGITGELASTLAREIGSALDTLTRLLAKLKEKSEADQTMTELIHSAQEEVSRMTLITGRATAIQKQHDNWQAS
jgi:PAS domain S-box-containing protein